DPPDRRAGLHPRAGDRAGAPLPRGVVAAGPCAGLGERLQQPGAGPDGRDRREPGARRPGRPLLPRLLRPSRPAAGAGRDHRFRRHRRRDRGLVNRPHTHTPSRRSLSTMAHPHTLFTGQWADLTLDEVAELAAGWGYDGLEIAVSGEHLDASRWDDDDY